MMLELDHDRCRRRGSRSGVYRCLRRSCRRQWTYYRRRGSDLDLALAPARVWKGMREGAAREWRGSQAAVPMRLASVWTGVAEGLGFGAGGEMVRLVQLENGDGGGDDDSL